MHHDGQYLEEFFCKRWWLDSQHSRNYFRGKLIGVTQINYGRWFEESGQWLENVDQTHIVLASGKPQQEKRKRSSLATNWASLSMMFLRSLSAGGCGKSMMETRMNETVSRINPGSEIGDF